ncbi:MAG: SMI1/KNR4 family protein [Deltaproteobacteria bacterium]|nr:SMI1/KNR4 family protein [Deltaproteobacteria bacterium]
MPFPLDLEQVRATERKLGLRLPPAYVARMRVDNGGGVRGGPPGCEDWFWELFPILDESSVKRMTRTCNDIIRETRVAKNWASFPRDAVAIAAADMDKLVFLPDPDRPGWLSDVVHWWDHETGRTQPVADDFSQLRRS